VRAPFLALLLAGCAGEEPAAVLPGMLSSDPSLYQAFPAGKHQLASGFHGLVKLTAELGLSEEEGDWVTYAVQGAGSLVVKSGRWSVVTARHVLVPDPDVRTVGDEELDEVVAASTRVAIGSLGIQPQSMCFSTQDDLAVLEVGAEDQAALVRILQELPRVALPGRDGAVELGATVEAWGFPAMHHPQVQKPAVSARSPGFFVLNQALLRGYSGGPVIGDAGGRKRVVGIISRADDAAQQTTVLEWSKVEPLLSGEACTASPGNIGLEFPGEAVIEGLPLSALP